MRMEIPATSSVADD